MYPKYMYFRPTQTPAKAKGFIFQQTLGCFMV